MHRLQTVAYVGKSTIGNNRHRVVDIRLLHFRRNVAINYRNMRRQETVFVSTTLSIVFGIVVLFGRHGV